MPLSLFDARHLVHCKYPLEGRGAGMIVCGEAVTLTRNRGNCPYCAQHANVVYALPDSQGYRDGLGNPHKKKAT